MTRAWIGFAGALALVCSTSAAAQGGGWQPPKCKLDEGHYTIRSARTYVVNASRTTDVKQRERDLASAERVLNQAVEEGQTERSGTWYYWARLYLIKGDNVGADSAFDRVVQLAPECAEDVQFWRRWAWAPLINKAVRSWERNELDTAVHYLKLANAVNESEPQGYINLGTLYANSGKPDSAAKYLHQGIAAAGDDPEYTERIQVARLNLARLYHRSERYDSAEVWYGRYLAVDSTSVSALSGLASVLSLEGRPDDAQPLYDRIIAEAEHADPLDLFAAGTALFRAKQYPAAASAFEAGLEKLPEHRDALYNLANTYLSMDAAERMLPLVERLKEMDPLGQEARMLEAAAQKKLGHSDETVKLLEEIEAMPLVVSVLRFEPLERRAVVLGQIENRTDQPKTGVKLAFEFINASGEVVGTAEVAPEAIGAGETADFRLAPEGAGIVSWRYKVVS